MKLKLLVFQLLTMRASNHAGTDSLRFGKNSTLSNLLTKRGPFSVLNASLTGMAAVSNFGDNVNWTGSILGPHKSLRLRISTTFDRDL